MRNIFDNYKHRENQLTHALACCLHEDRSLLGAFLRWVEAPKRKSSIDDLIVLEQSLPGQPPDAELEADGERKGLPDLVIHDGDQWCVAIESKLETVLTDDQLRRHRSTLLRRDFESVYVVALTKREGRSEHASQRSWADLYQWLGSRDRKSEWGERLRHYLRAAEVRFAREGDLKEGTLTMFDGFHFTETFPYSYGEGKRLIQLAMKELRKSERLRELGMDPAAPGRSAITGRGASGVWDYLCLQDRPRNKDFTGHPHLTLGVHRDHLEVAVTIPNGIQGDLKRRFVDLGGEELVRINAEVLRGASNLTSQGATVFANCEQRHFPSQRSAGILDAVLKFNLETSQKKPRGGVKHQPHWVELFARIPGQKRSNLQFQYRVNIPWTVKGLDNGEISLEFITDAWCAMKPLLDALRGGEPVKMLKTHERA
jgi:hypothetical protein